MPGFSMPNPLSTFVIDASTIDFDDNAPERRPDLAVEIVKTLAAWTKLDASVGVVFTRLIRAEAEKGAAIFNALVGVNAQDAALRAIASLELDQDTFDIFESIGKISNGQKRQRNALAHGLWGTIEKLPDALLLFSQREFVKLMPRVDAAMAAVLAGNRPGESAPQWDLNQVIVYRKADFEEIRRQIVLACDAWITFSKVILPDPQLRRDEAARHELLGRSEIRAQIEKFRKKRGEPPLPPL